MDTASANSLVTDSSAASSAWGGGVRVNNGSVNCGPDGRLSLPIMELAHSQGLRTGLVSTATITHATPAGFAAKVPQRADELQIARQYLGLHIDVLLGGGRKFFTPGLRPDRLDLVGQYSKAGYSVALDAPALAAAPAAGPLLGLFDDGHMPYSLDRASDPALQAAVPTLTTMARAALARLENSPRGFILQIEGARVDHGAHANDIGALLYDQVAFDETLGAVLEWLKGRDDTLLIVTSDHGNSNPGLNGVGKAYTDTDASFDLVARFRHTNTWVLEGLNANSSLPAIRDRVVEGTGIALDEEELDLVRRALRSELREGYRVRNSALIAFADVLSNHISVGWTGVSHTADFTELAALGPGSESIQGVVRNFEMYGIMARALGLEIPA
jgi:alkaline phosphatase